MQSTNKKAGTCRPSCLRFVSTACYERPCALRAPTVFSVRIKSASAQKTRFWIKTRTARGFIQDCRLRADVLFIRAQSAIRADGFSSAQHRNSATRGAIQVAAQSDGLRHAGRISAGRLWRRGKLLRRRAAARASTASARVPPRPVRRRRARPSAAQTACRGRGRPCRRDRQR